MKYKVVGYKGIARDASAVLSSIDARVVEGLFLTEDDVIKEAADADAVIIGPREPYSRKVIEALAKCKVISREGIGYDNIDVGAATEQGILVAYVPDASTTEVSDHTMTLLLSLSRRLLPLARAVREGDWQPGKTEIRSLIRPIRRLSEDTLGLVGLGRIGSAVCRKARCFGIRVIVYDPYASETTVKELGAEKKKFDEVLAESDFISLHAPLKPETRHILGLEQFRKMKPTACLINTARGGLIDEAALATALTEGYIAGAALDVTDPEPPRPDNPLVTMDNVIITGHTAFFSSRSSAELRRSSIEAVRAVLTGRWPAYVANPEVKTRANSRLKPV